jgi:hypothetical protein
MHILSIQIPEEMAKDQAQNENDSENLFGSSFGQ